MARWNKSGTLEKVTQGRAWQKLGEVARQEASLAFPAAKRAATHGLQAFWKKFSEEYSKERAKQSKKR
ncbi:MAG: hypothetical protein WA982_01500 [Rubrobacteraceae bacterium]